MAKKLPPVSEQLRTILLSSKKSRYRIAKEVGLTEASLSRFVNRVTGLTLDSIDKIGESLGLRLVVDEQPKPKEKGK